MASRGVWKHAMRTDDSSNPMIGRSDDAAARPAIVITGMHRSGTSLLASMLGASGVDLGDELIGPGVGNERGHFEDESFVAFHDQVLAAAGGSMYIASPQSPPVWDERQRAEARGLVAKRIRAVTPGLPWGFKDPRASLFLGEWERLLRDGDGVGDGARGERGGVVVVASWRPWRSVVDSLRRRRDPDLRWTFRGSTLLRRFGLTGFQADRAARMWLLYNRCLIARAERAPERTVLVSAGELGDAWPLVAASVSAAAGLTGDAVLDSGRGAGLIERTLMLDEAQARGEGGVDEQLVTELTSVECRLSELSVSVING